LKVKVKPETEIKYEIESEYGWLEGTYFPNRALEHFWLIFSQHVNHQQEPVHVDRAAQFEPYIKHAEALLERFARKEFENALKNLVLKIEAQTLIAVDGVTPKEATKRIDKLAAKIKKEIKMDLDAPKRGGTRKELARQYFTSTDELISYAQTVNSLRPLWGYVTNFFKQHDYELACLIAVKDSPVFINLTQGCSSVPEDLLRQVFHREDFTELNEQEKQALSPLGLALEHSRRELGISKYAAETLKKRYNEGKKLINDITKSR
jgi:hypothetical protein